MKLTAVSDTFMKERYYRDAVAEHPGFTLTHAVSFGVEDKALMRKTAYRIERGGPEAVPAPEEFYALAPEAEAVMVHLCPVTRRFIASAPNLKLIMVNRGGTENIDIEAATEYGIPVLSNPAHNANGVTELTVGLMLAESRNIVRSNNAMKAGGWREDYPGTGHEYELRGLKVGIVGFGNIGRRVARILSAFGCRLCFTDPNVPADDPDAIAVGCRKTTLAELMSTCDFVTLHARTNEVVIGREDFALMKPTAYFINTARPHLIDSKALYEMLRDRRITGAALDVHDAEPTDPADPMLTLDNVTLTSHRGGQSVNCYSDSPGMIMTEAEKLLAGRDDVKFFVNRHIRRKEHS